MLARKWVELVLKTLERSIRKISSSLRNSDDTVEGQSKAFRIWMFSSTAAILMMLLLSFGPSGNSEARPKSEPSSVPSLIDQLPDGFVLVPIEPLNFEAIDALIENHAYVDLYSALSDDSVNLESGSTSRRKRLIARGLPLVRAPKNPLKFAVLVKEADSDILTRLGTPVLVVVRKGSPKHGYPEPRKTSRNQRPKYTKPDFIVEEIPEQETLNSIQ
ncbi:MAG: hypothetical protein J0L82_04260 [Deltaproteobacteria bacterium]|jgi:hypothetical protein|nr:hypothetical protein [Deltaproteobacteria bacterium]